MGVGLSFVGRGPGMIRSGLAAVLGSPDGIRSDSSLEIAIRVTVSHSHVLSYIPVLLLKSDFSTAVLEPNRPSEN